ncbi:hypothetical protein Sjap_016195 [Stephania japonica]|uniref:TRF2/HOY1 PH-like domain-containing protein n=1 Tax=Stephania japonica TaxID=461633 RepID=A0AAP0NS51_9MAGN
MKDKSRSLFDLGTDSHLKFVPEMEEFQGYDFDLDDNMSSYESLDAQERSFVYNKMDMEEGSDEMECKDLKSMPPTQQILMMGLFTQCIYLSVPENTSPLGLILRKTPSFLDLLETKLSHSNACSTPRKRKSADADAQQINGKAKASNFSALLLQIGSWERVSRFDGDLVTKCYFAKRKLVWELLDGVLKNKIEVPWSDIASMKATYNDNEHDTLEIELLKWPRFFRETNPQPRKHTQWKAADDFTGGEASIFRRHFLKFPQGTLQRHYEKLLRSDYGLSLLSKKSYPSYDSPLFDLDSMESPELNDHKLFGLTGQRSDILKWLFETRTNSFPEQSHYFNISRSMLCPQYTNLQSTAAAENSQCSGFNGRHVTRGTSILNKDALSSLMFSLPTSLPDGGKQIIGKSNKLSGIRSEEALADVLLVNDGEMVELHQGKLKPISTTNEHKSNCWITEIDNPVSSAEDIIFTDEIDKFFGGFSSFGKLSNNAPGEVSSNVAEYMVDISGTHADFPPFFLEDNW